MAIKKSALYSSLWASCDELRGGMDASQYKDYILTLLFVKYVSDKYKNVKNYPDVEIPEGGSFDGIIALKGKSNIGEGIDIVIQKLAEANDLRGIIDVAKFNDETKLGSGKDKVDMLTNIVSIFQRPELNFTKNSADGDDLIGDAYEYLMRKFATESGKSKGQFYTPAEVSRILAKVVGIGKETKTGKTVYDPACGSGSLLIRAADEAPVVVSPYGQEKDNTTAGLAKMNLVLHNKANGIIKGNKSTFSDPQFFQDEDKKVLQKFDYIVANPPFSTKNWTNGLDDYDRFIGYGDRPPEKNGDYAWLLHILKSLKPKGKAAVILPHGVLFRGNSEATIRKTIIDKGYIKGIIGLPANLFYGTGIPACIIVIDKEDAEERKGIYMIDGSKDFVKDGNKNRLRERDIYKIVKFFNEMIETEPKFARFVPNDEIKVKNEYNLNIPRYINSSEEEDLQSIEGHLHGGIPSDDIEGMEKYWKVFTGLKCKLFSSLRDGYYKMNISKEEVRETVYKDEQFTQFAKRIDTAFEDWQSKVNPKLYNITKETKGKELIIELAEEILIAFQDIELIDKYDVYQTLMTYWQEIMADDIHVISIDGYKAGKETVNITEITKSGKNKGKEKVTGWEGKLIPKSLIEKIYFPNDRDAIDDLQIAISGIEESISECEEENSGEDGVFSELLNDKDNIDSKKVNARLKELRKQFSNHNCTDEELEELDILKKYTADIENLKTRKGIIKTLYSQLEDKVKQKYKELSEDEIKDLIINQKWYATIFDGIDSLYTAISHSIANRIVELAERYEYTLEELDSEVKKYETKVKEHLKKMGFVC